MALLAIVAGAAALIYRSQSEQHVDPFSSPAIIQTPDAFDRPYATDTNKATPRTVAFPFKTGDRVAWIGSSSTYIGVWSNTMQFLLNTRHPELNLSFSRHSVGGGTYGVGLKRLPDWLERSHPTLVVFNYGANDAMFGQRNLNTFHGWMRACTDRAKRSGARVIHMTPQSGDIRASGPVSHYRRLHYSDDMLAFCDTNAWDAVDVFHPLDQLQTESQKLNPNFSLNADIIHLTDSAYVAWGFYLYDSLNPPPSDSSLELDARSKKVIAAHNCSAKFVDSNALLTFEREDDVLPILPPDPLPEDNPFRNRIAAKPSFGPALVASADAHKLPPRAFVPLEKHAQYLLKISGLEPGIFELACNGKPVGTTDQAHLAAGINLNTLYLDAGLPSPWESTAEALWHGSRLHELPTRKMTFTLSRAASTR